MNEDIEVYLDSSGGIIESLAKARKLLVGTDHLALVDEALQLELELAVMGAAKAKSEILKATAKDTVRPIK